MNGDLLHSLEPPSHCTSARCLLINREGYIAAVYNQKEICVFSINGRFLLSKNADTNVRVSVRV